MKKLITLLLIFSLGTLISFCSKIKSAKALYLPQRSHPITQSPQEYLNAFIPMGKVILIFYADWCNPCKRMCPLIDNLAESLTDYTFIKINRDYFKDLAPLYQITSIPTLIFLYNGNVIGRYDGKPLTQDTLNNLVKKIYKNY